MPAHTPELDIQPFGRHVQHRLLKDVDPFGHGLSWTSLGSLVKELLHLSVLRDIFHAHRSLE